MPRTNLQYARDFNPYAKGVTIDELLKVRRQLAKVMNQRIVRLRDTKSPITGESYTFGAYDLMSDYLKNRDKNRFSEVLKPQEYIDKDTGKIQVSKIKQEIRTLQGFEELKSSRVGGMHEIEAARVATFMSVKQEDGVVSRAALNEKTVTSKDFYDFLNSKTYTEISESMDSDKLVEEYDVAADRGATKRQIVTALNKYVKGLKDNERISVKGVQEALGAIKIRKK